jgi:hypothetical protein
MKSKVLETSYIFLKRQVTGCLINFQQDMLKTADFVKEIQYVTVK